VNELVVSKNDDGLKIALLKNKKLVELHHEKVSDAFCVGDLFLGKVKKIVNGLNAAFIDIGYSRDAFLHYLDLGPQVKTLLRHVKAASSSNKKDLSYLDSLSSLPDIDKNGKISDVLRPHQEVLVQIVKEPISTKGHRLSSEISLPGQYVVLVPFAGNVSVSKKIKHENERKRLKVIGESLRPRGFGLIIRTAAEGKDNATIGKDISIITKKWRTMMLAISRAKAPAKVLHEEHKATSILRDMLSKGFDSIYTDDQITYNKIHDFLKIHQPDVVKNLHLYKGKAPLFRVMGLEKQIKANFGKTVTLANGTYLVVEHTEAMHVIDVNSGSKFLKNTASLEENALKVNMEAASEIARQLRLRDMGGIIVIDFIDLKKNENKRALFEHLKKEMRDDRAKHSILPMSKFGLVEITRQRARPEIQITTTEACPSCNGSGKIQASILLVDEIKNNVDFIIRQNKEKALKVAVNPYVASYLTKGFLKSIQFQWFLKHWVRVKVVGDFNLPFTSVRYFNSKGEEIKL